MQKRPRGHAAKALKAAAPTLVEGAKKLLILRGPSSSWATTAASADLALLKKPAVASLSRNNAVRPFEDASSLEFLTRKADAAAFLLANHSKKRPHCLTLGRIFDGHLYDMAEMALRGAVSLRAFAGSKKALGSPPIMVFAGDWAASPDAALVQSLLLDVFGARELGGIALQGLDHVLCAALDGDVVHLRGYFMGFGAPADGGRVPRVELSPMGPFLDLAVRRTHHPSSALEKEAMRRPVQCVGRRREDGRGGGGGVKRPTAK